MIHTILDTCCKIDLSKALFDLAQPVAVRATERSRACNPVLVTRRHMLPFRRYGENVNNKFGPHF